MSKNVTTIAAEPGKQEIFITREFEAPRELVFKAFTVAEMYAQWLGPCEMKMRIERFEPKDGGSWRYVSIDTNGVEYGFHGVFHDITTPERIIQTFEFEGLPERGHVIMETAKFEALPGGRTKLIMQSVFQSVADRNGMVQAGMERGIKDSHNKLDELLAKELAE